MTDVVLPRIYLDTTVFVEAFDGTDAKATHLQNLLSAFRARRGRGVTSEVTLAEVLGKESPKLGWAVQTRLFLNLIVWSDFLELCPVSRDILLETGDMRRSARQLGRSIKLLDAIHIVTAVTAKCRYVLSSDKRFLLPEGMTLLDPHAVALQTVEALLDA